jgi:hypothetical protein
MQITRYLFDDEHDVFREDHTTTVPNTLGGGPTDSFGK